MSAAISDNNSNQDFEINLAPIIDCFTVLITYLLVSASFLSLAVFDVEVAINQPTLKTENAPLTPPPISLALLLRESHGFDLKVIGGKDHLDLNII